MIKTIQGNILDVKRGFVVQQVNCQGRMGAGLALQLRNKYPGLYTDYLRFIGERRDGDTLPASILLGSVHMYRVDEELCIADCFGQLSYGTSRVQTDYRALGDAFRLTAEAASGSDLPVAVPWGIGCGLAGGDWDKVHQLITEKFETCDTTVYRYGK